MNSPIDSVYPGLEKGLPEWCTLLDDLVDCGVNVLSGDLPMPLMLLKQRALNENMDVLQSYCDAHGAWLAPHGKTTMSPQLFSMQIERGAWAITVANITQLQVCRAFGFKRLYVANEMVSDYDARYLAECLKSDPEADIHVLVDSIYGVQKLRDAAKLIHAPRAQKVLIDIGMPHGRCGVRTIDEARVLAAEIAAAAPFLSLAGLHGYEGIAHGGDVEERIRTVDAYLEMLGSFARELVAGRTAKEPFLVSAGGSQYFDRVVEILGRDKLPDCQLVLRSGGYVTHDSGFYERVSPLGSVSERPMAGRKLQPAIEIWSSVISQPEPGLSILGMGGRDMPTDIDLPFPLYRFSDGMHSPEALGEGFSIVQSNDQHAYLRHPAEAVLKVGDLVGSGVSHPCTAFDKWRVIPLVGDDYEVHQTVRTFF